MRLDEKLHQQMLRKGLNGQKLARLSGVSDSEVSRILSGKSLPGLENAFKLARAAGVSLDFLADDSLESDPAQSVAVVSDAEAAVISLAREIGMREAANLLEIAKFIGYGVAMRRLLEAKPTIEPAEPAVRPAVAGTPRVGPA
ncbi:MAG: helix-turn-helix transcriptional regulator [Isosphaeraceae bacterium]|nr:helix-turn-helix transcriptional regulator [Isosphaeraceae bacterium]